jgi:transposase
VQYIVGNVSPQWQIESKRATATLDMSWSTLRNLLRYKCDHAGVAFAEVNESYTTQTCADCGVIGGPKGREGLGVRQWVYGDCGATHNCDRNAAVNIARIGCDTLGLKRPESSGLWAGHPDFDRRALMGVITIDKTRGIQ